MDPLTLIVSALVAGAAAGLKPTAEKAIKDGYDALKELVRRKYKNVSLDVIETDPGSKGRQDVLRDDLNRAGVAEDTALLAKARELLCTVRALDAEAAAAVGVDLAGVSGENLIVQDVEATGTGVRVKQAQMSGDLRISGVRAGKAPSQTDKS